MFAQACLSQDLGFKVDPDQKSQPQNMTSDQSTMFGTQFSSFLANSMDIIA